MSRFPKTLLSLLNIGILIFGVYDIVFAKNLSETSSTNECLRHSESSIQWFGVISSTVAVIGIIGTCLKLKALQGIYLLTVLISTISAVLFCVFMWAMLPGPPAILIFLRTAEHGTWLPEYSTALQKTLVYEEEWKSVTGCFKDIATCRIMVNQTEDQKAVLLDIGCCSPPNRCGLQQSSTSRWVVPSQGLNATDDECMKWSVEGQSCFDCDSCKAGYLGNFHDEWDKSTSSRTKCVLLLMTTSALAYYIFVHDHYYVKDRKDPKHGKLLRNPV